MRIFQLKFIILLSGLALITCKGAVETPKAGSKNPIISTSSEIEEVDILRQIKYLASDELGGRRSGTPNGIKAAEYVASEFNRFGLTPIDKNSDYLQPFVFSAEAKQGGNNSFSAIINGKHIEFKHEEDFRPLPLSSNDETKGEVIFAGYGISLKDSSYDDYKNIDATGKIVIVLKYSPDHGNTTSKYKSYISLAFKMENAREHGAAGIIFITPIKQNSKDELIRFNYLSYSDFGIKVLTMNRTAVNKLITPLNKTITELGNELDESGVPMSQNIPGVTVTIESDIVPIAKNGFNVMAILEGSDPELKDDYIIIGAHYDHLGIGGQGSLAQDEYGSVHNGADDNASGTAGMLELAEYFSANRKKLHHSILFQAYDAEESGLLGSNHYVNNPLKPLENAIAMLNLDMIGRDTDTSVVINGISAFSFWEDILEKANLSVGLKIDRTQLSGGRSDHFSFKNKGIPSTLFYTGSHNDYHRPSDDWEKINLKGEVRIVNLVRNLVWELDEIDDLEKTSEQIMDESPYIQQNQMSFRVVLGILPDYGYTGAGLKISSVKENGSASDAGMKDGDVLIKMSGKEIINIEDYMSILQQLEPGEEVALSVKRGTKNIELHATIQSP